MTKEALKAPIVACALGNLYNKEAVISYLLNKTKDPAFSHIKSLKDVCEVRFTPNPAHASNPNCSPFVCPITMTEVGGKHQFITFRECGCVLSKRVLKEIPSTECLNCGKPAHLENILTLNNSDEEIERLKKEIEEHQATHQEQKKERKKKTKAEKLEKKEVLEQTESKEKDQKSNEKKNERKERKEKRKKGKEPIEEEDMPIEPKKRKKEESSEAFIPSYLQSEYIDKKIYSSIFTSSLKENPIKETFLCRNVLTRI